MCTFSAFKIQAGRTSCNALLQSKLTYEDHIGEATYYASRENNVAVLQFELQHMPGPPVQPQNWYTWSHGTDMQGLIGILSIGRVLPTDAEVSGWAEISFAFYGKAAVTIGAVKQHGNL